MHSVIQRSLQSHLDGVEGVLLHDEPMAKHTSWRVGGKAEMFYIPIDKASLVQLMCQLPRNVPVFWMGLGSNILVRDAGLPGVVVCTFKGMHEIERVGSESVYAQAGVASAKLAKYCARHGLEGAEFLAGIPGSFGGAVAMNAGAFGGDTWSMIERIECLDRDGNINWFDKSEISYQYRHVELPENNWIVGAQIKLKAIKGLDLGRRIRELLKTRGNSQPVQSANAGSVFKNPENDFAARLLEEAGMKGVVEGGAEYSNKHANFIINTGSATARDIETLIKLGQKSVKQRFGIELDPEVRIVGRAEVMEAEKKEGAYDV